MMNINSKKFRHFVIMILIFVLSVIIALFLFVIGKKDVKISSSEKEKTYFDTMEITVGNYTPNIEVNGIVSPQKHILTSPVSGEIEKVNFNLKNGGKIGKGELLFSFDKTPLQSDLNSAKSSMLEAANNLEKVKAQADLNKARWKFEMGNEETPSAIKMELEIEEAVNNLETAKKEVEMATKLLNQTDVIAPFDCRLLENNINEGMLVSKGSEILIIHDVSKLRVDVSLPKNRMNLVQYSEFNGSDVIIDGEIRGKIYGFDEAENELIILANCSDDCFYSGDIVEVKIEGIEQGKVAVIPSTTLDGKNNVWVALPNGRVFKKAIKIVNKEKHSIAVKGLCNGNRIVLSNFDELEDGMKIE